MRHEAALDSTQSLSVLLAAAYRGILANLPEKVDVLAAEG
jgi:hypothetical protein